MGLVIDESLAMHFACDYCGQPIERLVHGLVLANPQSNSKQVVVHNPIADPRCWEGWQHDHAGQWTGYTLDLVLVGIGMHYRYEFGECSRLASYRADHPYPFKPES